MTGPAPKINRLMYESVLHRAVQLHDATLIPGMTVLGGALYRAHLSTQLRSSLTGAMSLADLPRLPMPSRLKAEC